jgi:hypothetical protein
VIPLPLCGYEQAVRFVNFFVRKKVLGEGGTHRSRSASCCANEEQAGQQSAQTHGTCRTRVLNNLQLLYT